MEILGIVDCPLWILLLLGIIASVVLYSKWKQNILRTLGLPGPKPALFFGIFPMYKQKTTDLLHECIDNLMIKIEDNSETSIDISILWTLFYGRHLKTTMFPVFKHLFRSMNYTPLPNEVVEYFTKISKIGIQDRKKELSESKDLLNCMIKCHVNNGYTNKDNRPATNEKWQQRLTDEIDETFQKKTPSYDVMDLPCLDMIMSETFRLYPPFLRFNRTADSSTCVQGQTIPKGMDVFFPVYAIHRHPDLWEEPDVFNPERFSSSNKEKHRYSYIPFGCGKRNCFGMELALLEVKLAAVKILQEYTIPPSFEKSGFLRPQNGIFLKFFPR
ncbi:hypothetical protein KUTeg_022941 [Tegillarca granosa]|uniref:hydroperoxy icosatetraenoate dehydratase n=1 Tax=Tegillarca granosa TaxID=220873 RepID=A0ABQ9E077_TEGGR|nr:hypothetical protein KUTeg_022941 [Tegillarca granosa]